MTSLDRRSVVALSAALATGGTLASFGSASAAVDASNSTSSAEHDEWASYRGTAGNTAYVHSDEGFDEPTAIAWEYDEGGDVAVVDGTVYLRTDDEVHALHAADGELRWESQVIGAAGVPAVTDSTVCVGGTRVTVLDALDGAVRWVREFAGEPAIRSPTVASETVFVVAEGTLYALEHDDGSIRWERDAVEVNVHDTVGEFSFDPQTVAVANETVYACAGGEAVAALDVKTGDTQWSSYWDLGVTSVSATADRLFVEESSNETIGIVDSTSMELESRVSGVISLTATEDVVVPSQRYGLTAWTFGHDERWSTSDDSESYELPFGLPVVVGDTVLAAYSEMDRGDILVGLDITDGSERWVFSFDDVLWNGDALGVRTVVVDDTVYVDRDGLIAIRASNEDGSSESDDTGDEDAEDSGEEGNADAESGDDTDDVEDDDETDEEENQGEEDSVHAEESESDAEASAEPDDDEHGGEDEGEEPADDLEDDDAGAGDDLEEDTDGTPGFTIGASLTGGALTLEWLRRRALGKEMDRT